MALTDIEVSGSDGVEESGLANNQELIIDTANDGTDDGSGAADDTDAQTDGDQDQPESKPKKVDKRFSEITKQRDSAKAEADALKARIAELEAKNSPTGGDQQAQSPSKKPEMAGYENVLDYVEAVSDWKLEQHEAKKEQKELEKLKQAELERQRAVFTEKTQGIKDALPDFDKVMASTTAHVSDEVKAAMLESDHSALIAYTLAKDPDRADKIYRMSIPAQLKEIAKLELQIEASQGETNNAAGQQQRPAARTTKAPPPINPIRSGGAANSSSMFDAKGEFLGSHDDYKALRKAGKI